MLENLQCNILKSHGRDYAAHIFLEFRGETEAVKNWIQDFSGRFVTSASAQLLETEERRKQSASDKITGQLMGCFFLSAQGYETLGFRTEDGFEESFRKGMKECSDCQFRGGLSLENKDPRPQKWELPYRGNIHAMILLAHDNEKELKSHVNTVQAKLAPIAHVLIVEYGKVLRNDNIQPTSNKGQPIEHFGYVDGRSQPLFLQCDIDEERENGGTDQWDPTAPLGLVLTVDPLADQGLASYGSYLVFRKLEQNVGGFNERVRELALVLAQKEEDVKRAGALVVGRFRDGTPLTKQATDDMDMSRDRGNVQNNFNYDHDPQGFKCPYHAHMRKLNPRGGPPGLTDEEERKHRIVRRGIPYGKRAPDLSDNPTAGVGLYFLCYQSNIHEQFEFLQRVWADNRDFPTLVGDDPLIGQDHRTTHRDWPRTWGQGETVDFNFFGAFVTLKGGEYFFAPSLSFLTNIAHV
jgi:Dyp-type peroxidase family